MICSLLICFSKIRTNKKGPGNDQYTGHIPCGLPNKPVDQGATINTAHNKGPLKAKALKRRSVTRGVCLTAVSVPGSGRLWPEFKNSSGERAPSPLKFAVFDRSGLIITRD